MRNKLIDKIYKFLKYNKKWFIFSSILGVVGLITYLMPNDPPDDNDLVDNKGALNPQTVIAVNKNVDVPKPQIDAEVVSYNQPLGDLYKTEILLTVNSIFPVPYIRIRIRSPTVTDVSTWKRGSVMYFDGTEIGEGYAYSILENAKGYYEITVITKEKESPEVDWSFQ